MEKLSVWLCVDGDLVEYELAAGQQMIVDTGNVAGFEETVKNPAEPIAGSIITSSGFGCTNSTIILII